MLYALCSVFGHGLHTRVRVCVLKSTLRHEGMANMSCAVYTEALPHVCVCVCV